MLRKVFPEDESLMPKQQLDLGRIWCGGACQTKGVPHTKVLRKEELSVYKFGEGSNTESGNPSVGQVKQVRTRSVNTLQGLVGMEFRLYSKSDVFS